MKLTHIRATNLHDQGSSLSYDIEPVTIFTGDNESGKTTALGLPSLVLDGDSGGVFPVLGASPDYTWTAGLRFDGGLDIERLAYRRGSSIKRELRINGMPIPARQQKDAIAEAIGSAWSFDLLDLLSLSPAKRQAWLEENVADGDGWPMDLLKVEVGAEVSPTQLVEWASYHPALSEWDRQPSSKAAAAWLIEKLALAANACQSDKRRYEANVAEHERRKRGTEAPSGTVAFWEEKLVALDAQRGDLRQKFGEAKGADQARFAVQRSIDDLRLRLHELETNRPDIEAIETVLGNLGRKMEREALRVHAAEDVVAPAVATVERLEKEYAQAAEKEADAVWAAKHSEVVEAARDLAAMAWNVDHNTAEAIIIEKWLESFEGERGNADTLEIQLGAARRSAKREQEILAKARREYITTEMLVRTQRKHLDESREHLNTSNQQRLDVVTKIQDLEEQLAGMGSGNTDAIMAQLDALEVEREDMLRKIRALNDHAKLEALYLEHLELLGKCEKDGTAMRAAAKQVRAIQGKMLADMMGALSAPVADFVAEVYGQRRSFVVDLQGGASLIATDCGKRVDFANISRSQWAIYGCGVKLATTAKLGGWRNLIADDMENIRAERLSSLLEVLRLRSALGGFDNFLGAVVNWPNVIDIIDGLRGRPGVIIHEL